MILADKIINLRKRNGWSQEELADRINVSRQAVSKWEGSQATPDLDKILAMANLFGVTTDYLLKDEIETEEFTDSDVSIVSKRVSLTEAHEYLKLRKVSALKIAYATFLCILSPVLLIVLGAYTESHTALLKESTAIIIGLSSMFVLLCAAVALYLNSGFKNTPYEYLDDSSSFELEYGVKGMVKEQKQAYTVKYRLYNTIGTCVCMMSPLPLIITAFFENEMLTILMLAFGMITAGIGVIFFISAGVRQGSFDRLLCEGDYKKKKNKNKFMDMFDTVFWLCATAVYLTVSFITMAWHITWIIWPIAAVINGAAEAIIKYNISKNEDDNMRK